MVRELYLEDSYLTKCDATVVSITDSKFIVLDQTVFYPNGGGQPWDTGKIVKGDETYQVVYVRKVNGEVSHEVDRRGLQTGDKVNCLLSWDRRYKLMRSHTASHVFASLLCIGTGALVTGNQIDLDKTRFDFNLEEFDRNLVEQYINEANQLFVRDIPILIYELPREEALRIPGIVKMAEAFPPEIPALRIVEIVGIDKQADGGTHVKNLREVGKIRFLKVENKGKNNRRVYFSVE